jgi:hypothetical protein
LILSAGLVREVEVVRQMNSLATLLLTVAFFAVNFSVIRWGLGLPNLNANGMIQEIIIGGTPMATILLVAAVVAMRRSTAPGSRRSFWIGFVATGTCVSGLFVFSCLRFKPVVSNYIDSSVSVLDSALRHIGLIWRVGDHGLRYAIVIAAIVVLLGLPQFGLAVLGGFIGEFSRRRSTAPTGSAKHARCSPTGSSRAIPSRKRCSNSRRRSGL